MIEMSSHATQLRQEHNTYYAYAALRRSFDSPSRPMAYGLVKCDSDSKELLALRASF